MGTSGEHGPLVYDRAIWTKFARVTDIPDTARVKLVLCNISKRPIIYKFKNKAKTYITAEPSASGKIPAHGISYCLLNWRRPPEMTTWKEMKATSLAMISEFEGSDDPNINEHTVTKIKCRISSSAFCDSTHPPEEHVTFKSALESVSSIGPSPQDSPKTGISPIIELPNQPNSLQTTSKNTMTVKNEPKTLNHSPASPAARVHVLYLEAKGAVVIILLIVILIMCFHLLLETKSTV